MSTRSNIVAKLADGRWGKIYCHFDGYLRDVGRTLLTSYQSQEKIEALIALGDLSALGSEVAPPEGVPHSYARPQPDVCIAYGRDRGDEGVEPAYRDSRREILDQCIDGYAEYVYLWTNGCWYVYTGRQTVDAYTRFGKLTLQRCERNR